MDEWGEKTTNYKTKEDRLMEELERLAKEIEDMKTAYQEKARSALSDVVFPDFFKAHPEIKVIYWTQYTPYFNDGEPCVFSVGEVCISDDVEVEDYYESFLDGKYLWDLKGKDDLKKDFELVASFIEKNEELMQELYDDHCVVKIFNETPVRTEVEEYDHD